MADIETGNDQQVGVNGHMIVVMRPRIQMTKTEALRHAAWLVALADHGDDGVPKFEEVLKAVQNT